MSDLYVVKKITVLGHSSLSLQSHKHRREFWIIISGNAVVTIGENEKKMGAGESVCIREGIRHRMENRENIPICFIEVQFGDRLEEQDITRFEDQYQRDILCTR